MARLGDERVLVPGGIPGERARVGLLPPGPGRQRGRLVELLSPSPERVTPRCRHAAECGGCDWQHIAYPAQLRYKQRLVQALLRRALGPDTPEVAPTLGLAPRAAGEAGEGAPWGFRQKVTFAFGPGPDERGLVMGHYARGSHEVIPVEECPVHAEGGNAVAFALLEELRRARLPPAGEDLRGLLRHVVVRCSSDGSEAVAMLVATREDRGLTRPLRRLLARRERPTGLVLNLHDRPGPFLVGRESLRVDGAGHVQETGLGPTFLVSPQSFFQTCVEAAGLLVRLVLEALPADPRQRVLDLYAGSGLFALPLALRGQHVTAIEESRRATREAAHNARLAGVPQARLRLVPSKVEEALPRMLGEGFDSVVLDPPRQGCPPAVLKLVFGQLKPARVVYVSCNPEALAHELPAALRAGYRVRRLQPVDMFPHTAHVETVTLLERQERRLASGARPSGLGEWRRPVGPKPRRPPQERPRAPKSGGRPPGRTKRPGRA